MPFLFRTHTRAVFAGAGAVAALVYNLTSSLEVHLALAGAQS